MTDPNSLRVSQLEAQIAALTAKVEELERRGRPSAPMKSEPAPLRDLTENASMPPSAMRDFAIVVPTAVLREIANDRKGQLAPARSYSGPPTPSQLNRSGVRSAAPLDVPGVALADRLMDAADARDRAEKIVADPEALAKHRAERAG